MKTTEPTVAKFEVEQNKDHVSADVDRTFDPIAFDAAMKKWQGFLREELLADGFTTTEELMNDIRSR